MPESPHSPPLRIPASFMRGGTSKGVFFLLDDLPEAARRPGPARDALLMRVIGSPDPYGKQIDGMGGASSSTSKCVIISRSSQPGHDVDYLYGQVSIDQPLVDWSGNCGNLSSAVGPFAIAHGLIDPQRVPRDGICTVRIWQANIGKTILAEVPICKGMVQEDGDFELDGVTFPAAEVRLSFLDPGADDDADATLFPTGQLVDTLEVPGVGKLQATLIHAGIPTVFVEAEALGLDGSELQPQVNGDAALLDRLERIRAQGALRMGLIGSLEEARTRQHTPKIAWVAAPASYLASSGREVAAGDIDLRVRALSMGKLHHAMMATCAVAIATAAAVPGTLVHRAAGGGSREAVRVRARATGDDRARMDVSFGRNDRAKPQEYSEYFEDFATEARSEMTCSRDARAPVVLARTLSFGHPSGTLRVGASVCQVNGQWTVTRACMSRSARVLMEGWVRVPAGVLDGGAG